MDVEYSLAGVHIDTVFLRKPMVHPVIFMVFLWGLFRALKRRSFGDKLCLSWLILSFLAVTLLAGFVNRHFTFAIPVIHLIAAVGMAHFCEVVSRKITVEKWTTKKALVGFAVVVFTWVGLSTYQNIFTTLYGQMDGNLNRMYGQAEMARFIQERADPQEAVVVLGDNLLNPYDAFLFHTRNRGYVSYSWWDQVLRDEVGSHHLNEKNLTKLTTWEAEILSSKKKIFYVFPVGAYYNEMPGWNLASPVSWDLFKSAHPTLAPSRRIYFSSGVPRMEIYEIDRNTGRSWSVAWNGLNGREFATHATKKSTIRSLSLEGPANAFELKLGSQRVHIPIVLPVDARLSLTYDRFSYVEMKPVFDDPDFVRSFELGGISFEQGENLSWFELTGKKGVVEYKIEAPRPISRLEVKTNPWVFNNGKKTNCVNAYFSTDNITFHKIYEVRSDGSQAWSRYRDFQKGEKAGLYERETYHVVEPQSSTVFLAFVLEGNPGEVRMVSELNSGHTMTFRAYFDGSQLPKIELSPGVNYLVTNHLLPSSVRISIAGEAPIQASHVFEGETLSSSSRNDPVSDTAASKGRARLARLLTDPVGFSLTTPFAAIAKGIHSASFRLKADAVVFRQPLAKLQLIEQVRGVERVVEERSVFGIDFPTPGSYCSLSLYFESDGSGLLAQRLVWLKRADLRLDCIEVLPVYKLLERENLSTTTGHVVEDLASLSGKVKWARSSVQPPGLLAKGNFVEPWKRSYTLYVSLKTSDNSPVGPLARIKVRSPTGRQKIAEIDASQFRNLNSYQKFGIEVFTGLSDPRTLEERISDELYKHGKSILVLEIEDSHPVDIGINKLADTSAINGFARRSTPNHPQGHLVVVTHPDLSPGFYVVALRMKVLNIKGENPAVWIDVNPEGAEPLGRDVLPLEFDKANAYQNFFLGFSVTSKDRKQSVQYRVLAYTDADIYIDRLEVREVDDKLMVWLYTEGMLRLKSRKQASFQVDYLGRADLYINNVFLSSKRSIIHEAEDTQPVDIGINKVKDPSAHNGFSRNSTARHVQGHLIVTGDAVPAPGKYRASFWLKVPDNTDKSRLGQIEVAVRRGGAESVVTREIRGTDFVEKDKWQPLNVDFQIDSEVTVL